MIPLKPLIHHKVFTVKYLKNYVSDVWNFCNVWAKLNLQGFKILTTPLMVCGDDCWHSVLSNIEKMWTNKQTNKTTAYFMLNGKTAKPRCTLTLDQCYMFQHKIWLFYYYLYILENQWDYWHSRQKHVNIELSDS